MTYSDLLKDPRWQRKRLEILQRDNFTCQRCGDSENTLHIHHNNGYRQIKPWEYESHELQTLCEPCHKFHHDFQSFDEHYFQHVIETVSDAMKRAKETPHALYLGELTDSIMDLCALVLYYGEHPTDQEQLKKRFDSLLGYLSKSRNRLK